MDGDERSYYFATAASGFHAAMHAEGHMAAPVTMGGRWCKHVTAYRLYLRVREDRF